MRGIIDEILNGNFEYENGALDFSCSKLEISLKSGEVYEGSFVVDSTPGTLTKGFVTTSDMRMECLTRELSGNSQEIKFCFHAEGLEAGEVVKGNFNLISNHGEYYLPFIVQVERNVLNSSIGPIKNLFHFANLAKSNWDEAVNVFYSKDFEKIFNGSDIKMYDSYRALSGVSGNQQNVEEFLIHINKKQRIEYFTSEEELVVDVPFFGSNEDIMELEINITKNGWGYTALNIECDSDFVYSEKTLITDDDFLGNKCRLPIYIDLNLCRQGNNFGRVVLFNSYVGITIPVLVRAVKPSNESADRSGIKKQIVKMMKLYEDFRLKKISAVVWREETGELVDKFIVRNEDDIAARLFQAQLLISEERLNEAEWILKHAEDLLDREEYIDDSLQAYYLYLTTLIHREEEYVNKITAMVKRLYVKNKSNFRIAWLLLYLSEEYNKSPLAKWVFLEEQYYYGCTSPIFYIEAIMLLCTNPSLLRKLDSFEVQVINYGLKNDMITEQLYEQMIYVAEKIKDCSPLLFNILVELYRIKKDVRVLQQICTVLIKNNKVGEAYFEWYELGVENQLRITNIYEYYMMSLDLNKPKDLPKILLMYFSYENNLDYERCAYLYEFVVKHKNDYPEIFEVMKPRIGSFVDEQIRRLRINRSLASLYQAIVTPELVTENNSEELSRLVFSNIIRVDDYRLRRIYVYHPEVVEPEVYSLRDKTSWVSLYGNDYTICFEDAFGNRFTDNVEYRIEKLMIPGKYVNALKQFGNCYELFNIYAATNEQSEITDINLEGMLEIAAKEIVFKKLRHEVYIKILDFLYEKDDWRKLEECLSLVSFEELSVKDKQTVMRYMVIRGKNEEAFGLIAKHGPYFADSNTLLRLVSYCIQNVNMFMDKNLFEAARYSFAKGKYDQTVIAYLALWFQGSVKEMRDIFVAARSFDVDCYRLAERILIQMMFSGAYVGEKMDIFKYYISQGAKQDIELAFLSECSYEYFVNDKLMEEFVFDDIHLAYLRREEIGFICKLAYVKYYSENKEELNEEKLEIARVFIEEIIRKDIYFNFLREYGELKDVVAKLSDKSVIEYKGKHGNRCRIHYVRVREDGESEEYVSQYMKEVCGGVFFKEFILFFGETLQYYITEENGENSELTESGTLSRRDIGSESYVNKYYSINEIMISKTLQDYDTLDITLKDYYRKEFLNEKLFSLM